MHLADDERVLAESAFGMGPLGGVATLTSKRIVLLARDSEESIPLRAVTSVRAGFTRDWVGAVWGLILLVLALSFGATYKNMETAANGVALAIERRVTEKMPDRADAYGHYVNVPGTVVWLLMLPLIALGGLKCGSGLRGRTELAVSTASGVLLRSALGRQPDLISLGEDAGRQAAG
jgi:hypothetical protein